MQETQGNVEYETGQYATLLVPKYFMKIKVSQKRAFVRYTLSILKVLFFSYLLRQVAHFQHLGTET
jgi:hypothetical protein